MSKLKYNRWLSTLNRQKQQYWYKGFQRQLLSFGFHLSVLDFLLETYQCNHPFASHSINPPVKTDAIGITHLNLAVTIPHIPP